MFDEAKLREYMSEFVTGVTDAELDEVCDADETTPGYEAGVLAYKVAERVERERVNGEPTDEDARQ